MALVELDAMTRWLDNERIVALTNAGRLRENTWRKPAPEMVGNCELVEITSGGVESSARAQETRSTRPVNARNNSLGDHSEPLAGVAPGPLTHLYSLVTLCRSMKIAEPTPEYRFHPTRRWRFDYAWPLHMLALEVDGGVWTQGRHTRGQGAIDDMEKASEAAILGWRLLYCTPDQLRNGVALDRIIRALTDREAA